MSQSLPGKDGSEVFLVEPKPTTIRTVKQIFDEFDNLRALHPDSAERLDNLEGAFQNIMRQYNTARTLIETSARKVLAENPELGKALQEASENKDDRVDAASQRNS